MWTVSHVVVYLACHLHSIGSHCLHHLHHHHHHRPPAPAPYFRPPPKVLP